MHHLDESVQRELEIIKQGILEVVPAEAIYLFGSYAYGTPNEGSDLDIYVVVPDNVEQHPMELSGSIYHDLYARKNLTMPTDIMVNYANVFNRRKAASTLQRTIAQKGLLLHG